jgi:tetratricopeptide (TPR) repeat protein
LAIKDYTAALEIEPENARVLGWRGMAWHLAGERDKALDDFTEAIRIEADDADLYKWRAYVAEIKGNLGKALEDYTAALRIDPDDEYAREGYVRASRAKRAVAERK